MEVLALALREVDGEVFAGLGAALEEAGERVLSHAGLYGTGTTLSNQRSAAGEDEDSAIRNRTTVEAPRSATREARLLRTGDRNSVRGRGQRIACVFNAAPPGPKPS